MTIAPISAISGWWFQPTPLKNMSSSNGMMNFPTEWKNKSHVPNHQPDIFQSCTYGDGDEIDDRSTGNFPNYDYGGSAQIVK